MPKSLLKLNIYEQSNLSEPRIIQLILVYCGMLWRGRLVESGVIQRDVKFDLVELISPVEAWARAANSERQLDAIYGAVVLEIDLCLHFLRSEIGDGIHADEQPGLPGEIELFRLSAWRRGFDHVRIAIVQLGQAE